MEGIPIIDLRSSSVIDDIRSACSTFGFFYLRSDEHVRLREEMLNASRAFFQLPQDIKARYMRNEHDLGYTAYMAETLDPSSQSCGDTKEGFNIMKDDTSNPNIWPTDTTTFDGAQWKHTMNTYFESCYHLAASLLQCIAQAADLPPTIFDRYLTSPVALLRLLHYSPAISTPAEGVYGCGAHTDYGLLTLLSTDDNAGLQIYWNGRWVNVPPHPDMFIVNLGDCLERYTKGYFRSTLHRVVSTCGCDRFSSAFFYEPDADAVVKPLEQYTDRKSDKEYDEVVYGQYLSSKYNSTHKEGEFLIGD